MKNNYENGGREIVTPKEGIRLGSIITRPDGSMAIEVKGGIRRKRTDSVSICDILEAAYRNDKRFIKFRLQGSGISVYIIFVDSPSAESDMNP